MGDAEHILANCLQELIGKEGLEPVVVDVYRFWDPSHVVERPWHGPTPVQQIAQVCPEFGHLELIMGDNKAAVGARGVEALVCKPKKFLKGDGGSIGHPPSGPLNMHLGLATGAVYILPRRIVKIVP